MNSVQESASHSAGEWESVASGPRHPAPSAQHLCEHQQVAEPLCASSSVMGNNSSTVP